MRKSSGERRIQSDAFDRERHGRGGLGGRRGTPSSPPAPGASTVGPPTIATIFSDGLRMHVEDRLRIEADPEGQDDERRQRQLLAHRQVRSLALAGLVTSPKKMRW